MKPLQEEVDTLCRQWIDAGLPMQQLLRNVERAFILRELERKGGNKTHAAQGLGMHRNTFARHLQQLGIARRSARRGNDETSAVA